MGGRAVPSFLRPSPIGRGSEARRRETLSPDEYQSSFASWTSGRGVGHRAALLIRTRCCTDHTKLTGAHRILFEAARLEWSVEIEGLARLARCGKRPSIHAWQSRPPAVQT